MISENSLGMKIHHTEDGVSNFWNWFGNSKNVDEHGRPIVFFHGTSKEFDKFIPNPSLGSSIFVSPDPKYASNFTNAKGGHLVPVYVKSDDIHPEIFHTTQEPHFKKKFEKYDTIRVQDHSGDTINYAISDPTRIKSIFNNGNFQHTNMLSESNEIEHQKFYNFVEWKKAARQHGYHVIDAGKIAGTLKGNDGNMFYANHEDPQFGGQFIKGKSGSGWNYGHLYVKKVINENRSFMKFSEIQLISESFNNPLELTEVPEGHPLLEMSKMMTGKIASDHKVYQINGSRDHMLTWMKDGALEIHHVPAEMSMDHGIPKKDAKGPNPRFVATAITLGKPAFERGVPVKIIARKEGMSSFYPLAKRVAERNGGTADESEVKDPEFYSPFPVALHQIVMKKTS